MHAGDDGSFSSQVLARTAWDGVFLLELDPGVVMLQADKEGFAPSELLRIELGPAETRRDLELWLRFGGSVVGEVVDADGRAFEKAWVILGSRLTMSFEENFSSSTHSDARGHFEFTDVPPGDYELETKVTGGLELRAATILAAGDSVFMRLEPARSDLTRLHGRVTLGGEAHTPVQVSVKPREPSSDGDSPFSTDLAQIDCAADGSYELYVPASEVAWFHVAASNRKNDQNLHWRTEIQVPSSAECVFDLDLPLGRIRGRVQGADGRALAGVRIVAHPGEKPGWNAHYTETDAEGRYDLEVVAGVFTVRAGDGMDTGSTQPHANLVQAYQPDLSVAAGQVLERVDFVLREGGEVAGVALLEDGSRAAGVALYSWSGTSWDHVGWSDENGSFHLAGLAPGTCTLGAAAERFSTRHRTSIEVRQGLTTTLELTLLPRVQAVVRAFGASADELLTLTWTDDLGQVQALEIVSGIDLPLGWIFPGRHYFHLQAGGRAVEQLFIVRGNEPEVVFELELQQEMPNEPQDWPPEEPQYEPPPEDSEG